MRCRCSVLLLILAFAGPLPLAQQASSPVKSSAATLILSPAEQAAWKGEETYWQFQKADDRDAFVSLWDERFVGWLRRTSVPIDKDRMREDLKRGPDRKVLDYKLEPLSVREYGGSVVITLYRATVRSTEPGQGRADPLLSPDAHLDENGTSLANRRRHVLRRQLKLECRRSYFRFLADY